MDATRRALMNISGLDLPGFSERVSGWLGRSAKEFLRAIRKWNRRYRTRRDLLEMEDRILKDIGINRSDALKEGKKAFWEM